MIPQEALNLFIVIFFIAYLIYEYIRDCKNEKKLADVKSKCMKRSGMEMTDNDIVKGLEYCVDKGYCPSCPCYDNASNCKIEYDALDLINRQKAEIERLESDRDVWQTGYVSMEAKAWELSRQLNTAKAEAVKEFAERLKEQKIDVDVSFGYGREVYTEAVAVIEIDNLVKEKAGES